MIQVYDGDGRDPQLFQDLELARNDLVRHLRRLGQDALADRVTNIFTAWGEDLLEIERLCQHAAAFPMLTQVQQANIRLATAQLFHGMREIV